MLFREHCLNQLDRQDMVHTVFVSSNSWLSVTLQHLINEVRGKGEGSKTIITRLTELMYVEVLRHFMNKLPEKSEGWLAGVRDPEIGKVLKYLH